MNAQTLRTRCLQGVALALSLLLAPSPKALSGDNIFRDGFDGRGQTGCYADRIFLGHFDGASHAPVIAPIGDRGTVLGDDPINIDLTPFVSDADPGDRFIWSLTTAPPGMSIQANTGVLSWTPLAGQQGAHNVTVEVCDYFANVASASFLFSVIAPTSAPLINVIADRSILVDTLFQQTVTASTGGAGPNSYSLDEAPLGMQVDAVSGQITWMPGSVDLGSHPVVVRATNRAGQADTEPFTLTVIDSNAAPVLAAIADQGGKPGELFTLAAQASDADGDPLGFFLPTHPPGMSIDPDSGVIRWTPASQQLGPHEVAVRVSDPLGFSDTKSFALMIDSNRAPVAVDDGPYMVERGDTLHVPAPGLLANDYDPNNDPLTAVLGTGPAKGVLELLDDGSFNYTPDNPAGTVGIKLKWAYRGRSIVQQTPVIIDLDGDGIAEIITMDGAGSQTQLYALHGDTGEEYFKMFYGNEPIPGGSAFAVADIDLDGHPDIITIGQESARTQSGKFLMAFDHTGQLKWISEPLPERYATAEGLAYEGDMRNASITVADIDQDGTPEILVGIATQGLGRIGYQVWDNQGNKLDYVYTSGSSSANPRSRVDVIDLDLDGVPEIIMGSAAWTNTGELLWSNPAFNQNFASANLYPLVANLDADPYPEMVRWARYPAPPGTLVAWNHDGSTLWTVSYPGQEYHGFGMISIADVDNDGKADIIVPPGQGDTTFRVLNGADGSLKWSQTAPGSGNDTSNTGWGATVMDLDNDGYNEVIYLDGNRVFRIWDGRDGTLKLEVPSGENGSSYQSAMPIFADIDGDGHAELITIGAYALGPDLIRVYESPLDDWPPMRAIWNQDSYHVTNINDDGTVPQFERPHWLLPGLNQNLINQRLPEERFSSTDLFTYRASDGELQSNLATVDITILPPNAPPQILSTARLLASPGFEYTYAVLAVDADVGETLSYALQQAPAGMAIDANHVIRWTPTAADVGDHGVVVSVTDSVGVAAYQSYTLRVVGAVSVPGVAGQLQADAVATLVAAGLRANPIEQVHSDSVPVGFVVSQAPAGGSNVAAGSDVRLNVSKGVQPIAVPNVLGSGSDDAQDVLGAAGLLVGTVSYVNDAAAPRDTVLSQDPAPHSFQLPTDPVDLVISGGPRALITVSPGVIMAGDAAQVDVSVHDTDGSLLDPQPVIELSVQTRPGTFFGTLPSLIGTTLQTAPDSQGGFEIQAVFNVGTPETITTSVTAMQAIAEGPSGNLFSEFGDQLAQFSDIVSELKAALDASDTGAIAALDAQLADLGDAIDTLRLGSMTPLALVGGVPPTPADAAANGFPAGPDDFAYKDATLDLIPLLQELEQAVADDATPPAALRFLNQSLGKSMAALDQLDVQTYGVLDSAVPMINIIGTRMPPLIVANIERLRQSIADSGLVGGMPARPAGAPGLMFDFSLGSMLSSMSIQTDLMQRMYGDILYQLTRSMGTVIGADIVRNFANNTTVTGLITASSIAMHVFNVPDSVIEGYGFNTVVPQANNVRFVGPDLIESVLDIFRLDLPEAKDFRDLNTISDKVSGVIEAGQAFNDAYNQGSSLPDGALRGCLFENSPNCRQLVYSSGIKSVYTSTGGFDLPAPVVIIIYTQNGMGVYVANFLPTRE